MGLILDTCILIAGERRGDTARQLIEYVCAVHGDVESAISVVSIVELTHGVYRANSDAARNRRETFVLELSRELIVHPVSLEIARLAGRIEGEQAAQGNIIDFEDLLIGTTALHLGYDVATLNIKHFRRIPGLTVVTL